MIQPFIGGINTPQHEFIDVDGDGDLDLFIFDNDLHVDYYRNEGTARVPDFRLCTTCSVLPSFQYWFLFVDLNGDGKVDLCTDDSSNGVRFYRNDGTLQNPDFVLQTLQMLDSAGNPVNAGFSSIPVFVDIDGDRRIDFLSSNSLDGSINFYKNIGTTFSPLLPPGEYEVHWNASDVSPQHVDGLASGVYYYRLMTNESSLVRKMILMR